MSFRTRKLESVTAAPSLDSSVKSGAGTPTATLVKSVGGRPVPSLGPSVVSTWPAATATLQARTTRTPLKSLSLLHMGPLTVRARGKVRLQPESVGDLRDRVEELDNLHGFSEPTIREAEAASFPQMEVDAIV